MDGDIDASIQNDVNAVYAQVIEAIEQDQPEELYECFSSSFLSTGTKAEDMIDWMKTYIPVPPTVIEQYSFDVRRAGSVIIDSPNTGYQLSAHFDKDTYLILSEIDLDEYTYLMKTNYVQENHQWKLEGCQVSLWKLYNMGIDLLADSALKMEKEDDILTAYAYMLQTMLIESPFDFYSYKNSKELTAERTRIFEFMSRSLPWSFDVSDGNVQLLDIAIERSSNVPHFIIYYAASKDGPLTEEEVQAFIVSLQSKSPHFFDVIQSFELRRYAL